MKNSDKYDYNILHFALYFLHFSLLFNKLSANSAVNFLSYRIFHYFSCSNDSTPCD